MNKNIAMIIFVILVIVVGAYLIFGQNIPQATAPEANLGTIMEDSATGNNSLMEEDSLEDDTLVPDDGDIMEDDDITEDDNEDNMIIDEPVMEQGETKVFNLNGKNFEFSTKEIKVKKGDTVTINFTSESGFHDWVVDEFGAQAARVQTGDSSSVTFVADQVGTFEYYCSVGQHRQFGMIGALVVEE